MRTKGVSVIGAVFLSSVVAGAGSAPAELTQEDSRPRASGTLVIGGTPHPYLAEGTGLTCVVVGPATLYPPLFTDRLKRRIRFVYVDFKNSWSSESAERVKQTTLDSLVDEVDQVRRSLGLGPMCLVGHSAPGLVAVEYTLRHPDRVSHVVLVGVEPYLTPDYLKKRASFWEADASADRKAALRRNVDRISDDLLQRLSPRDAFALRYVRNSPRYFYDRSYDLYWTFYGRSFSAEMVQYFLTALVANYDPRPRLVNNSVPILLVLGRYDYNIPYVEWDGLRETIPRLTSHVLDKSGHFPMLEQGRAFDETVMRWLETVHHATNGRK